MNHTYHLNGGFKPTLKRTAEMDGPDFFPTPAWAIICHRSRAVRGQYLETGLRKLARGPWLWREQVTGSSAPTRMTAVSERPGTIFSRQIVWATTS